MLLDEEVHGHIDGERQGLQQEQRQFLELRRQVDHGVAEAGKRLEDKVFFELDFSLEGRPGIS